MKRIKGFTLIELIGVIVIVSLLVLLITPAISGVLKESKEKLYNKTLENIKLAAKNWASDEDNKEQIPTENGNCLVLGLKDLKDGGYVDLDIKDPRDGSLFDDDKTFVVITKNDGNIQYDLVLDGNYNTSCYVEKIDPTAPVISANIFNDIRKNFDLSISYSDDYGLLDSNKYEYYLSSSSKMLSEGEWLPYENGISQNIGQNKDGKYYVFVKRISNIEGKQSALGGVLVDTDTDTYQRFGPYNFDNTKPVWTLYGKTNTNTLTDNDLKNTIYAYDDDTITITFRGNDLNFQDTTLTIDDLKIYIGGVLVPITDDISLSSVKNISNGVEYTLTLTNLTQKGILTLEIGADTLIDKALNTNDATIINTGFRINECIYDIGKKWTYTSPGTINYKVMCDGTYKVTLKGGQGGGGGGYGATTYGEITLKRKTKLNIYVGGAGDGSNGGYNGGAKGTGGGGGATDIRADISNGGISLPERIMVAAGGGGTANGGPGGDGGTTSGGTGTFAGTVAACSCLYSSQGVAAVRYSCSYSPSSWPSQCVTRYAEGGQQTRGGNYASTIHFNAYTGAWTSYSGTFGYGGEGIAGGGGGGGWYGGAGGTATVYYLMGGGGGSSCISYPGSKCYNDKYSFTNYGWSAGSNAGNGSATIELISTY